MIKIRYCLASHNRRYVVKKSCTNLEERLKKVYSDLAERFPERGYEVKVIKNVASDLYIVKEEQKPYEIIFRDSKEVIEVFVKVYEFKQKLSEIGKSLEKIAVEQIKSYVNTTMK